MDVGSLRRPCAGTLARPRDVEEGERNVAARDNPPERRATAAGRAYPSCAANTSASSLWESGQTAIPPLIVRGMPRCRCEHKLRGGYDGRDTLVPLTCVAYDTVQGS